jgi:hypothetical protein
VTAEEGRQFARHAARILKVQQVPSAGENERLNVR